MGKSLTLPNTKEVPAPLRDALYYLNGYYHMDVDEENHSKIAFLLLELEGDKAAIKEISEYIQKQHADIKFEKEKTWNIANKFLAVFNWTVSYIRSNENKGV